MELFVAGEGRPEPKFPKTTSPAPPAASTTPTPPDPSTTTPPPPVASSESSSIQSIDLNTVNWSCSDANTKGWLKAADGVSRVALKDGCRGATSFKGTQAWIIGNVPNDANGVAIYGCGSNNGPIAWFTGSGNLEKQILCFWPSLADKDWPIVVVSGPVGVKVNAIQYVVAPGPNQMPSLPYFTKNTDYSLHPTSSTSSIASSSSFMTSSATSIGNLPTSAPAQGSPSSPNSASNFTSSIADSPNGDSNSPPSMTVEVPTPSNVIEPPAAAPEVGPTDIPSDNSPIATIPQQSTDSPVVSIAVSDGSSNSTASQFSTDLSNFAHSKTNMMIAGAVVLVLIAVVVGFMIFGSDSSGVEDEYEESKRLVDEDELGSSRRIRRRRPRGDR